MSQNNNNAHEFEKNQYEMSMKLVEQIESTLKKQDLPEANRFSFTSIKRITTTAEKKPDSPDFELTHHFNKPIRIDSISLVFDDQAKTDAMILCIVGKDVVLKNNASADFTDITEIVFPVKMMLERGEKVELYVWNGAGSDEIAVTASISISS